MSKSAARLRDMCSGHAPCYPPRPNVQSSNSVIINGRGAHRKTDAWDEHCCSGNCHTSVTADGTSSVYIDGLRAARVGDPVGCGSIICNWFTQRFYWRLRNETKRSTFLY